MHQEHFFRYLLRLGDTALINSQRLSEWTGHGPFLEEDLALTNISLDILGRAHALLNYAGRVEGKGRTEDDLAFRRGEREFNNQLITELPNGDYAFTLLRQFLLGTSDEMVYSRLMSGRDPVLSGIAAKAVKEIAYHNRHTEAWMQRFGQGTEESRSRTQQALNEVWRFTGELFEMDDRCRELVKEGYAADLDAIRPDWESKVRHVLVDAGLSIPSPVFMQRGGLDGKHTEHLGYILAEMQFLPRAYPDAKW